MHRPNPSTRDGACAYCNFMENIKSNADSAGFAETVEYFVVSLEKLNYMEKRMMNQRMRAHECVRMVMSHCEDCISPCFESESPPQSGESNPLEGKQLLGC